MVISDLNHLEETSEQVVGGAIVTKHKFPSVDEVVLTKDKLPAVTDHTSTEPLFGGRVISIYVPPGVDVTGCPSGLSRTN
jgi:hypothetical protein